MSADTAIATYQNGRTALQLAPDEYKAELARIEAHKGGLFPAEMTHAQAALLAQIAVAYHLDPIGKELTLYEGQPYVAIAGRIRVAQEDAAFDGVECRPATKEEREAFRCSDDEHLWVATAWRKDRRVPVVAYGRASSKERMRPRRGETEGRLHPVASRMPQEMAYERAIHRALRYSFPLPIPGAVEHEDDGFAEMPSRPPVIEGEASEVFGVTNQQLAAIHAIYKAVGWTEDDHRDQLEATYGVRSSKDLTEGQADAYIDLLRAEAEEEKERPRTLEETGNFYRDLAASTRRTGKAGQTPSGHTAAPESAGAGGISGSGTPAPAVIDHAPAQDDRAAALAAHAAKLAEAQFKGLDVAGYAVSERDATGAIQAVTSRIEADLDRQGKLQGGLAI